MQAQNVGYSGYFLLEKFAMIGVDYHMSTTNMVLQESLEVYGTSN